METGTQQKKESLLYHKTVYIAIPKRLFDDAICNRARDYVRSLHPFAVIDPRGMFKSNAEWLDAFPRYLKPCEAVIAVTENGFIGKGTYDEIKYFSDKNLPCYQYVERGKFQNILSISGLHIVDWNNWIDYARIEYE